MSFGFLLVFCFIYLSVLDLTLNDLTFKTCETISKDRATHKVSKKAAFLSLKMSFLTNIPRTVLKHIAQNVIVFSRFILLIC